MMKNKYLLFLVATLILLVAIAIFANFIAPYDPYSIDLGSKLQSSSSEHLLGTDHLGRDVLSRLIYGTRMSLLSVLIISGLTLVCALTVGCIAGYRGGWFDSILMRICDVFLTFPTFILALFLIGVLGVGLINVILAIIITHWAWYARIVRSLVLEMKSKGYVLAAKSAGGSHFQIIVRHILPSVVVQLLILATLDLGHMLLHVAGLSFLGLGVQAPTAEWGVMINDAAPYIRENPELMIYPGLCIFIIVTIFNSLGEVLRDKLDPSIVEKSSQNSSEKSVEKVSEKAAEIIQPPLTHSNPNEQTAM
jgi:nickel transport system permease protein